MKYLFCAAAFSCFAVSAAQAQDTFEFPDVSGEVLSGWNRADGKRVAALRLTLDPGWKTYWRAPGDAGIPPRFDWSGSENLDSVEVVWPTPSVFDQSGLRSVGYENVVVIPLNIQPTREGATVHLKADMELGICSDICIPYELSFDAELSDQNTSPTPVIVAALAQQPYSASESGVRAVECAISPTSDGLQIEARVTMPSAGAPEYVVIEPGPGEIWVSEAKTKRHGSDLVATSEMVNINGGPIALDRSTIRITVLGSDHAVDIRGCTSE
ncbi:MAG: protein-disulfide reductase DsbD domain-containing protein [Roseobacter sp.]